LKKRKAQGEGTAKIEEQAALAAKVVLNILNNALSSLCAVELCHF